MEGLEGEEYVRVPPRRMVSCEVVVVDDRVAVVVKFLVVVLFEGLWEESDMVGLGEIVLPVKSEGTVSPASELVRWRLEPLSVVTDWELT